MAGSLWKRIVRYEPGISLAQWLYDRIANNWDRLLAAFIAGGGMSYLASITGWMAAWGPLGVGAAGLFAAAVVWVCLAWAASLRASAQRHRAEASAIEKWKERVDAINPLLPEFNRQRIRVADLAHPIAQSIADKRLIDCELIGPANLALLGGHFQGVVFMNCDIVVARLGIPVRNAVAVRNVTMIGGAIWNCTLLLRPAEIPAFVAMNAVFLSLTGRPEIDNVPPGGG